MSYQHYSDPNYPPMGGPPPRKPSPWASPAVLIAIIAGIIVLGGGVVAAVVYSGGDSPENVAASDSPSAQSPAVTHTETAQPPTTHTVTETPAQVPTTAPVQPGTIGVAGADRQGFANFRCNAPEDPAVFIGYTERSRVVICQVGSQVGRNYYKGLAGETPLR